MHHLFSIVFFAALPILTGCTPEPYKQNTATENTRRVTDKRTTTKPCPNTYLICETFEDSRIPQEQTGNISLSSLQSHTGKQSLQITASGNGYNTNFLDIDLADIADLQTQLYGRMFVYLSGENALNTDFTLVQASGTSKQHSGIPSDTTVMYRGRIDGRNDHVMANYDTWVDRNQDGITDWLTDCWKHPNADGSAPPPQHYLFPKNEWSCVQWYFNSKTNEMRFWLNKSELTELQIKNRGDGCLGNVQMGQWTGPESFTQLSVGIEQYHSTAKPKTLYIDNLVVDDSPIPCQ
ncbi:hypothetical protein [Teredinibacter haidensis]|uniref:hypothetical protein n=1 Tax=Teredinibacter haidensis TaxID=2731755 RepID=UPI0009490F2A|nr:hypothetical protein [Teredinibacter haidensis]